MGFTCPAFCFPLFCFKDLVLSLCMCISVRVCAHECNVNRDQKRVLHSLELELQEVQKPNLGSPARALHSLNHCTISLAAWSVFINTTRAVYFLSLTNPCFVLCFIICIVFASPNSNFILILIILVLSHQSLSKLQVCFSDFLF